MHPLPTATNVSAFVFSSTTEKAIWLILLYKFWISLAWWYAGFVFQLLSAYPSTGIWCHLTCIVRIWKIFTHSCLSVSCFYWVTCTGWNCRAILKFLANQSYKYTIECLSIPANSPWTNQYQDMKYGRTKTMNDGFKSNWRVELRRYWLRGGNTDVKLFLCFQPAAGGEECCVIQVGRSLHQHMMNELASKQAKLCVDLKPKPPGTCILRYRHLIGSVHANYK